MDRADLSRRISSILSEVTRLTNALCALNITDIKRYPENYEVLSTDAVHRAERITCRLRHLVYLTTKIKKEDYLVTAADIQGIEIEHTDGILNITLPCLFPRQNQRQNLEYLLDPLIAALSRYTKAHPMPRFRKCMICFSVVYSRELPQERILDYDDQELKRLQDVVASFFLTDDSGRLCDDCHITELGEADCTRISIMDTKLFPEWYIAKKSVPQFFPDL